MIVSASRRTDIPAVYPEWLLARLAAGEVEVANPFRPTQVRRVDLRPAPKGTLQALVLWTRNPRPLVAHLEHWERKGIRSLWLVTITGYPEWLEPAAPSPSGAVRTLRQLAGVLGPQRIAWRYDPVLLAPERGLGEEFHRANFRRLAERITPWVGRCIVSTFDDYAKARGRLTGVGVVPAGAEQTLTLTAELADIAREHGLAFQCCAEATPPTGVEPGACIDAALLNELWALDLPLHPDPGQRRQCRCTPTVDIGAYDTCTHGCLYCYATGSPGRAAARRTAHNPDQLQLA